MWNVLDLAFQSAQVSQDLSFLRYVVSFLPEKGSFGPGLDAPELEMAKVLPGSPNRDLKAHFLVNKM